MGFRFDIEYKQGASNRVADVLFHRDDSTMPGHFFTSFCQPPPSLLDVLRHENQSLPELQHYHQLHAQGQLPSPSAIYDGLLYYKHRLCLGTTSTLIHNIIQECHTTPSAGHPGVDRTFHCVAISFYWPCMRADIHHFVAACFTC